MKPQSFQIAVSYFKQIGIPPQSFRTETIPLKGAMKKKLLVFLGVCISLCCILILVQGAYYYYIFSKDTMLEKSDLILVFPGGSERIATGYLLAKTGFADNLSVSGIDKKKYASLEAKYGDLPKTIKTLTTEKSRTTFEDALSAGKMIRKNKFKSVILVTSSYHVPRALLLLQIELSGTNTQIQPFAVKTQKDVGVEKKLVFNEMVKCWGSIIELAWYKITGNYIVDIDTIASFSETLKDWLLLNTHIINSNLFEGLNRLVLGWSDANGTHAYNNPKKAWEVLPNALFFSLTTSPF